MPATRFLQQETDEAVILSPAERPSAAVIWLHGLGADGYDFVPLVPQLPLRQTMAVRFVFPHAPVRPVTLNNGLEMRAWYDIQSLSPRGREDESGTRRSAFLVRSFIEREIAQGINAERIVIAGFSQGGALALYTALRYPLRLAGVLALSAYLPLGEQLATEKSPANLSTPILMCHGRFDPVVSLPFGELSHRALAALGYPVEWREYPMQHELCPQEIIDVAQWLEARLTPA
ncbi:MAG: alpha/beta hydrolase [Steroidobacterales bacterium]